MSDTPREYLQITVNAPLRRLFDYLPPVGAQASDFPPGTRVLVPFGKQPQAVGLVMGHARESHVPHNKIKRILSSLDSSPTISEAHLALLAWASSYYHHPVGEVVFQALPAACKKPRPIAPPPAPEAEGIQFHGGSIELNPDQRQALRSIQTPGNHRKPFLLYGVTGSGKTEVYLQAMEQTLRDQRQVLMLLPEIALTPQTLERFRERFSTEISLIHSGLTPKQRLIAWQRAQSGQARIILGTRSAAWTPLARPGLYIVDEEHDPSYKQMEQFRYSARDLILMRARRDQAPVILGSATPSLESLHNASLGKFRRLDLPERAGSAGKSVCEMIDLRHQPMRGALSETMIREIRKELDAGNQVLLFRNRRGYALHLLCHACGHPLHCPHCDHPYTWHKGSRLLRCHRCDDQKPVPKTCPQCGADALIHAGHGTERVEETLRELFPGKTLLRVDRDTTRKKDSLWTLLQQIEGGQADIIIGTQMMAKGHHFPNITLTGILDADQGLFSNDFRAGERLLQLLVQVSGRSGRGHKPGKVLIQTHFPDHPLLRDLDRLDYLDLIRHPLHERRECLLPPYTFHALMRAKAADAGRAHTFLEQALRLLPPDPDQRTVPFGPVTAPVEKRAGMYRMHLLLQSSRRQWLHETIRPWLDKLEQTGIGKNVRWSIDIDPQDML